MTIVKIIERLKEKSDEVLGTIGQPLDFSNTWFFYGKMIRERLYFGNPIRMPENVLLRT